MAAIGDIEKGDIDAVLALLMKLTEPDGARVRRCEHILYDSARFKKSVIEDVGRGERVRFHLCAKCSTQHSECVHAQPDE